MLVLSRGNNDKVVFPSLGISVEILRIAGNKVRLGIDAPKEIPVHRHEIVARVFKVFNELRAIEDELGGSSSTDIPAASKVGYRALIVDDDANERELLSGFLRMSGFQVETAVDGLQAMVQLTRHERPDVVLLDMRMPRFDGSKTISAIRCNPDYRGLKVFAVSGTDSREMNVPIGENGVNRWFSKPLDPNYLVAAIHEELASEPVPA